MAPPFISPDLNFEIVHAGLAFADETAHAIARFPNVYANLEITTLLMHHGPGLFREIIGLFPVLGWSRKDHLFRWHNVLPFPTTSREILGPRAF